MSAATKEEAGSEYTLYSVEVTPADAGEPWIMGLRAALTALMGLGNLPSCWNDVSKARSVTGRHRCAAWPPAFPLFQSQNNLDQLSRAQFSHHSGMSMSQLPSHTNIPDAC